MPLIVLLHGTNENMLKTQCVTQHSNEQAWMDLADEHKFVVLVPQSRGLQFKRTKYFGWQPGNEDLLYIQMTI